MDYYGFAGRILKVDLTTGEIEKEPLDLDLSRKFLGGFGVGMKFLSDYLKQGIDPFSPENPIIISAGTLTGTLAPGTPKISMATKYPTIANEDGRYFIGASVGGSEFGVMLKNAGYDHIIITGSSDKPVYLKIINDDVEICDASDLWKKKDVVETTDELREMYGEDAGVITIGEAGENLVRLAMTFIDKTDSLGRSGLGAVFGSKKLKAIVVRGTKGVKIAEPDRFMKKVGELHSRILEWSGRNNWLRLGMGAGWHMFKYTQYPGKWSRDEWDKLYGEAKRRETVEKIIACPSCLISCRIRWRIRDGEFAGNVGQGSPYGKSATSGQLLDITDHRKMLQLVILANQAGIDFYTATRMIDFVTTLFEKGKLTLKDTGGKKLERNYECYVDLFKKIIKREGFGDILADGWLRLAQRTGVNPQEYWYAGVCKGVDFIYDARAATLHPLMMSFFTNPRPHHGGNHTLTTGPGHSLEEIRDQVERWGIPDEAIKRIFTPTDYAGKFNVGRYTRYMEDAMVMKNSLGSCSMYSAFGLVFCDDLAELYSAATGIEVKPIDLMLGGERGFTLKKLLNVKEGFTRKDDKVPELWLRPMDSPEGRIETMDYFKTKVIKGNNKKKILDDYYDERGWDKERGIPTEEKVYKIGLEEYSSSI